MSHTANTAHTEPTTRRAARRGAVAAWLADREAAGREQKP